MIYVKTRKSRVTLENGLMSVVRRSDGQEYYPQPATFEGFRLTEEGPVALFRWTPKEGPLAGVEDTYPTSPVERASIDGKLVYFVAAMVHSYRTTCSSCNAGIDPDSTKCPGCKAPLAGAFCTMLRAGEPAYSTKGLFPNLPELTSMSWAVRP